LNLKQINYVFIGAFGNVKLAILRKDKTKKFALKAMKKQDIIQSKHVDHIENEKKILELMNHPFIVSDFILISNLKYLLIDEILWIHAR
jgi:serine/threonine protein kinase